MNLEKALQIATKYHEGQKDKGGNSYILHPIHVMNSVTSDDEKIVAILHDVIEDSSYTLENLKIDGFNEDIIEALRLLTHDKNIDYFTYIRNIKENTLARTIKIQDLKHNMDVTRLRNLDEKVLNNLKKYFKAFQILNS